MARPVFLSVFLLVLLAVDKIDSFPDMLNLVKFIEAEAAQLNPVE